MKYTGWGAMSNLFALVSAIRLARDRGRVEGAALSEEEYASARASTPNAHYTSPEVIQAMWQAMERFGLQAGAHILEPSMGVGHFFGLMPEGLYPDTKRTGVELDSITARIASKLYPDSNVHAKALEETQLPGNFFDAVIGNIPFGNYPVFDPAYRRSPHLTRAIHDYFLAKSLDVVRPGGVVALITSRYTMDKQDSAVRRHLADGSVLLGALRLPNTAFKANAGTEVTTDILFLQKRSPDMPRTGRDLDGSWLYRNGRRADRDQRVLCPASGNDAGPDGVGHGQYGLVPELIGTLDANNSGRRRLASSRQRVSGQRKSGARPYANGP